MKKLGLFGGSFDPIHNGHLHIAQAFLEQFQLDTLIFLPAGNPYHKDSTQTTAQHRFNMIERAIATHTQFAVSDCDIVREGKTYTYDTIEIFRQHFPNTQLFWLMGMDSLLQLHTWYKWQELVRKVNFVVASRPNFALANAPRELHSWLGEAIANQSVQFLNAPEINMSSSDIRTKLIKGENPSAFLPENVYSYIQKEKLYLKS